MTSLRFILRFSLVGLYFPTYLYHFCVVVAHTEISQSEDDVNKPTITVVLLVRNKAHALPYFFGFFENLNYPKDKITFRITSDHNIDNTSAILRQWVDGSRLLYRHVSLTADDVREGYRGESGPLDWTRERFTQVMKLRQQGLNAARLDKSDHALFVDADVLLENRDVLNLLIQQNKTIIGPMINATTQWPYSNFWGAADENGYYERHKDYISIVERKKQGCFSVHLVHSVLLVALRHTESRHISFYPPPYRYTGPYDDIIIFQSITKTHGLQIYVLNTELFGHMAVPRESDETLESEIEHFRHVRLEILVQSQLEVSQYISRPEVIKDNLGFDQIYIINLERRPNRRKRCTSTFHELGVNFKLWNAVDGQQLNETFLLEKGIRGIPNYLDPYNKTPLTWGEIGCFLSHYGIWKDALEKGYKRILIFEDDVRFHVLFREKLRDALRDADAIVPYWELMYLGRKILRLGEEQRVDPAKGNLLWPRYTYWSLSYALTSSGLRKLVDGEPLGKMVPVDEYLSIAYNSHASNDWMAYYPRRDLVAIAVHPQIVEPYVYRGESNYISDTFYSDSVASFVKEKIEL